VSRHQKGKTSQSEFTGARDSEWQWHQLGYLTMPVSHHSVFFMGQMPFLPHNQQHQSTEGTKALL